MRINASILQLLLAVLMIMAHCLPVNAQSVPVDSQSTYWKLKYLLLIQKERDVRQEEDALVKKAAEEYADYIGNNRLQAEIEANETQLAKTRAERLRAEAEKAKIEASRHEAESKRLQLEAEHEKNQANAKALRMEAEQKERLAENAKREALKETTEARILREQREAQRRRVIITTIGLATLIMAIIIIFLMARSKRLRKNYEKTARLNAELQAKKEEALETDKVKEAFIRNMSQELRTPLQTVLGMAQVLCDPTIETTEEEQMEYGEEIMNNINFLIASIDDILNVSDIQSGNFSVTPTTNDIAAICNSTAANVSQFIPPSVNLELQVDLPEGFKCVVDPRRTQQVLMTYINNAAKHDVEGTITLRASLDGRPNHLTFAVTDPSRIQDSERVKHLFEKKDGHHNVALYLCAAIAEKMNGHAWYDETYTQGSRFCFDIPLNLKDAIHSN